MGIHRLGWSEDSQEEAIRRAFEFCELISDGGTCTLYAIGTEVFFNFDTFELEEPRIVFGPAKIDVDFIPLISDKARMAVGKAVDRVKANGTHMVLALERFGGYQIIESEKPITQSDQDRAVKMCSDRIPEPVPGGFARSCLVYSIDLNRVWTREAFEAASMPPE